MRRTRNLGCARQSFYLAVIDDCKLLGRANLRCVQSADAKTGRLMCVQLVRLEGMARFAFGWANRPVPVAPLDFSSQ